MSNEEAFWVFIAFIIFVFLSFRLSKKPIILTPDKRRREIKKRLQESDYEVGDYFSGVLLKTFKEAGISRFRVRPLESFPGDVRVVFPRQLREKYPIGTRFRALVKVSQKTDKATGIPIGREYLVAVP